MVTADYPQETTFQEGPELEVSMIDTERISGIAE
jgi:hypothetical protein